jgi:ketosteroid isomerase-like protein
MPEESTTRDLVGVTLRSFEAVRRGDVDAMMSYYGPDSIWDNSHAGETMHEGPGQILDLDEGRAAAERVAEGRR